MTPTSTLRTATVVHICARRGCPRVIEIGELYRITTTARSRWRSARVHVECERSPDAD